MLAFSQGEHADPCNQCGAVAEELCGACLKCRDCCACDGEYPYDAEFDREAAKLMPPMDLPF